MTKICSKCKRDLPESDFYVRKTGRQAGRLYTWCKSCTTGAVHDHRRAKREAKRQAKIPKEPETIAPFDYADGGMSFRGIDSGKDGVIYRIEPNHNTDEALAITFPPHAIERFQEWQARLVCLQEKG